MRRLLILIAASTLSWLPGAVEPAAASEVWLPQEPQLPARRALVCEVPNLPPKDLSKLPEIEWRSAAPSA
ncbi:MAG TPA: hypothetical protein VG795_05910 [Acidimicrobiia bacterium]|nr:hypothetical protein [Acidimicrobiia bacterium]